MNKKGFTLVELIAVIVILGMIIIIAYPAYINIANDMKKSNFENTTKILANTVLNYANKYDIDNIKPANNTCSNNNCCIYYSIEFIKENNIFLTTTNDIINPKTNESLDGFIKVSYDVNKKELYSEYKDNANDKGNCIIKQ